MKTQTLEDLISEYLEEVEKATNLLELSFGTKNILGLWRSKKIPQRGKLSDDATYELHGIGCRVYISEKCIDFLNSTHKCNAHPCMHFVRRLPAQALARA